MEARNRWIEYSQAKDIMFEHTDTNQSPWWVVNGDVKNKARLNCITHLLSQFDYGLAEEDPIDLPDRRAMRGLVRPPLESQKFVPETW